MLAPATSKTKSGQAGRRRVQDASGRCSVTSMGTSATTAYNEYGASPAGEWGLPVGRETADAKKGAFGTKGAGHLALRSSSCPLTEFTRIVPLVLQSFKTTIVNIV